MIPTTEEQALAALQRLVACIDGAGARKGEWAGAVGEARAALARADSRPENKEHMAVDYCITCRRWTLHHSGVCARHTSMDELFPNGVPETVEEMEAVRMILKAAGRGKQ